MGRLLEKLNEQYASHYQRVNKSTSVTSLTPKNSAASNLMYGDYIRPLSKGSKILDLGCGTGLLLSWLSTQTNITPVGVDGSQLQVEIASSQLPDIDIQYSDGLAYLKENPNTFDGIFCMDVLEHIPEENLLDWVEGITQALKPGGFLICRAPNGANVLSGYSRYMDLTHQRCFTRTSIIQLLEVGGLTNADVIPIRVAHLTGKIRLNLEWLFHKSIFLLTGRGLENIFTSNIVAVGFKPQS